jgi:putative two-component system response regulator
MYNLDNAAVLIIDDDPDVLRSLEKILGSQYDVVACNSGKEAMGKFSTEKFAAVLSDVKMSGMTGIDVLDNIHNIEPGLPVILMTAYAEVDVAVSAVKKSAFDFIIKPFQTELLFQIVDRAIRKHRHNTLKHMAHIRLRQAMLQKSSELASALAMVKELNIDMIKRLTNVAECRDEDTGEHIIRIGQYAEALASEIGMSAEFVQQISMAAQTHDIGKIGISDSILLKPGPLTKEEFEIMKTHTIIGERILGGSNAAVMGMAAVIALTHHERWDGTGYPQGIVGEGIPLEGRIVFICDQYDALRSRRPYKEPLTHEAVMKIFEAGDGRTIPAHFDPALLAIFWKLEQRFKKIFDGH